MSQVTNKKKSAGNRPPLKPETSYRALLDSALDCIIWTDDHGKIIEFNPTAQRTFRMPREVAIGRDLSEAILPAPLRPQFRSELFASIASRTVELIGHRLETKAMRADGKEFPAEITVTTDVAANRISFIVYVRDITARRRAEETVVRLAAIVESSLDGIIGTDLDCRITSWNKGAELMYGYTSKEAIGKHISMIAPSDRKEEITNLRRPSSSSGYISNFETIRIAKNGRALNVLVSISPVTDSDGIVVGTSAIDRDITAYMQAQDALRKASETSIYASPVPIVAIDREHRVTMWNPAAQAVFGWSEEELLGKPSPVNLGDDNQRFAGLYKRAFAGEPLTGVELQTRKRDESPVTISLSATPLWDGRHQVKGIIGFLTDITERKRQEEALRTTEQKYRTIFENSIVGIYQTTPQGKYISANPALARMLGFSSPDELIEARTDLRNQEYAQPEMHEEFVSLMRMNDKVHNFEYQAYRKDGKIIWVSEDARTVRDPEGRILYFEGTVQDVTEQRELEQQLRQMQKMEVVGQLAGGVAHDFNNLLMAISSYSELLQGRIPADDRGQQYLDEICRVVDRGASLTQGLLTFSRNQVLSPKVLNPNKLVSDQIKMLRRLVPESIELKFSQGNEIGCIRADSGQIGQLVMNLVINARDAITDGGQILIETTNVELTDDKDQTKRTLSDGKYIMIAISDNGCGMDAAVQAQMFEPFFTTKKQGKGTGLGLAIVSDIVRQIGGQIVVRSAVGLGTTFKIFLPRVDAEPYDEREETSNCSILATETILLVEDEDTVRDSIAEYLTKKGYTVLNANGPAQALALASQFERPIHLVLTDVIMPQMNGSEMAERIKKCHPESKVIFMSGYSNNLLSNRQLLDARYVLLQKPLRLSTLAKQLREALGHANAASSAG